MISRKDLKILNLALRKLDYIVFTEEINNGKYKILNNDDRLVTFLHQLALEQDKEKSLQGFKNIFLPN